MHELERAYVAAREKRKTRVVTVVGATGLGKTRLVRDFLLRVREKAGPAPRVFRGTAREGGPAYDVFARVLRARFGIVEGMDPEAAKAQVRAQLATVLEDRKVGDVAYFLGQLLELRFQDSPLIKAVEGDPQQIRSMRRAVIKSFFETDASRGADPLVLVFDDLHWAHDDSLDLLSYLIDSLNGSILALCITRPETLARRDGWRRQGSEGHTLIELAPLGEADAAAMMRDLLAPCADAEQIEELIDAAVTLAGGNPALFEQIVRVYHDAGVLVVTDDFEDERWSVHPERLAEVKLPLSVEDAVQARIAALVPEERELLERAASMGGVFWLGGLVAIRRQGEVPPELWEGGEAEDVMMTRQLLAELVERDYVLRLPDSTFSGDEEYVFKHNLEREALERLTPPGVVRRYHRAIAEWLSFRESVVATEEYLEMLARHRDKAGAVALAASSYVQAGDAARSRYANAKAAELYAKGVSLLEQSDHADADLRITALYHYGDVLQATGRTDEAYRAFLEMLTRAWRLDLRNKGGQAHARIGRLYRDTGRLDEASRQLTSALALFGQALDEQGIGGALDDIGRLHWLKGDYALALEYTLRALALHRKAGDKPSIAASLANLGQVQRDAGNPKAAVEPLEQSLRLRRDLGDLVGVSAALDALGGVAADSGDVAKAMAFFEEACEAAKETGDRNRIAIVVVHMAEASRRLGQAERSGSLLAQAEGLMDELGDRRRLGEASRALGAAYLAGGDYAKAVMSTERAVESFTRTESKVDLGLALRLLAEVTAGIAGAQGAAATHYKRSIAVFEEVGNDVELARTSEAYAALLRRLPDHATDPHAMSEATRLSSRARQILAKARGA